MRCKAAWGWAATRRQAAALGVGPAQRLRPTTVWRPAAMPGGSVPHRPCARSSSKGTARPPGARCSRAHGPRTQATRGVSPLWGPAGHPGSHGGTDLPGLCADALAVTPPPVGPPWPVTGPRPTGRVWSARWARRPWPRAPGATAGRGSPPRGASAHTVALASQPCGGGSVPPRPSSPPASPSGGASGRWGRQASMVTLPPARPRWRRRARATGIAWGVAAPAWWARGTPPRCASAARRGAPGAPAADCPVRAGHPWPTRRRPRQGWPPPPAARQGWPPAGLRTPPDPPDVSPSGGSRPRASAVESLTPARGVPPRGAPTRRALYNCGSHRAWHDRPARGWPPTDGAARGDSGRQGARLRPRQRTGL
jgi:hypothetical protein